MRPRRSSSWYTFPLDDVALGLLCGRNTDRANVHRLLAYHLLALVSSKQVGQVSPSFKNLVEATGEEGEGDGTRQKSALNSDGAWCFREDCEGTFLDHFPILSVAFF